MKRLLSALALLGLASCATSDEPGIVKKPHTRVAKASILPGKDIPAERDGVPVDATGAIMFVCSNSDKHEDKEVLISRCPACGEVNYFFRDFQEEAFRCYACTKLLENDSIRCPDCGRPPRMIRTKHKAKTT